MDAFEQALAFVIGHEGGYTAVASDPGNWTGGRCGAGECRGTHWGISAAAYPQIDIHALTQAQAGEIYRRDYWDRAGCGRLPPPLALLVFDAAVNNGVGRARGGGAPPPPRPPPPGVGRWGGGTAAPASGRPA